MSQNRENHLPGSFPVSSDPRRKVVRIGRLCPQFGFHQTEKYEAVLDCGCQVTVAAGQQYAPCFEHWLNAPAAIPVSEAVEDECRLLCRIINELSPGQETHIPFAIQNEPVRLRLFIISLLAKQVLEMPQQQKIEEILMPCFILPAKLDKRQ